MKWNKESYLISVKRTPQSNPEMLPIKGYVAKITQDLSVGISSDTWYGKHMNGVWVMSILPEGLAFRTMKTKREAQKWLEDHPEFPEYVNSVRKERLCREGKL